MRQKHLRRPIRPNHLNRKNKAIYNKETRSLKGAGFWVYIQLQYCICKATQRKTL